MISCAKTKREEELLIQLAKNIMERLQGTQSLFVEHGDLVIENSCQVLIRLTR